MALLLLSGILGAAGSLTQTPVVTPTPVVDPWSQVRFLEGEWIGVAEGEPGVGTVHRSY